MEKVIVKKDVEWLEGHVPPRCKKPRAKVAGGHVEGGVHLEELRLHREVDEGKRQYDVAD